MINDLYLNTNENDCQYYMGAISNFRMALRFVSTEK